MRHSTFNTLVCDGERRGVELAAKKKTKKKRMLLLSQTVSKRKE